MGWKLSPPPLALRNFLGALHAPPLGVEGCFPKRGDRCSREDLGTRKPETWQPLVPIVPPLLGAGALGGLAGFSCTP